MSAFDETVKFLKENHNYLFLGPLYEKFIKIVLVENNYNFLYCLYYINYIDISGIIILEDIIKHFLNIKNKKLLNSFKKYINIPNLLFELYKDKMVNNHNNNNTNIIKNLIFLGANINSDFLLIDKPEYDIDEAINLNNILKELKNSKICEDINLEYIKKILHYKKEKIECYELIKKAYYAQKINRFIKYYYDDKYRLTKFRYNLEKNKYLRILKEN